jgi:hypothetical protein
LKVQIQILSIFSVLTFALIGSDAFAGQGVNVHCIRPAEQAVQQCQRDFQLQGMAAVQVIGAPAPEAESSTDAVETTEVTQDAARDIQTEIGGICEQAANDCQTRCNESIQYHNQRMEALRAAGDVAGAQRQLEYAQKARDEGGRLCNALAQTGYQAFQDAVGLNAAGDATGRTGDALGEDGSGNRGGMGNALKTLAYGGMAAAAGMCLFGSLCEPDEEKGGDEDDGTGGDDDDENAEVNCSEAGNHDKTECEDQLVTYCMDNPSGSNCRPFANHYCSLEDTGNTTDDDSSSTTDDSTAGNGDGAESTPDSNESDDSTAVATTDAGGGMGSSFCEYHNAIRYCEDSSNSDCPSCQQLSMQNNPVCAANPVACLPSISDDQLNAFQAQCPTDPIYASQSYIQNNSGTQPSSIVTNTTETDSLAEITGTGDGSIDYSQALQNRGGGVSQTFSVRTPSGVSPAMGDSLFTSNSNVYIEKCELGELNNCEPVAGL